jgi:FdhD protein
MVAGAAVLQHRPGSKPAKRSDHLAREEPLEIRVRGRSVAVTMRTPGHDEELAAGFLLAEGLIRERRDVTLIAHSRGTAEPQNIVNVFLAPAVKLDLAQLTRHVFASSSCGLCGKASIEAVHQHFPPLTSQLTVAEKKLFALPTRMRRAQPTFVQTGGLHAAAVFDATGDLIVAREDIGRHNAVDKVLGHGFLGGNLPFDSHVLLVSGRASFEIMQKALAAQIPIVCAVSAPSSLAVEFARESGQTLVGFLRDDGMNVYAGAERVV